VSPGVERVGSGGEEGEYAVVRIRPAETGRKDATPADGARHARGVQPRPAALVPRAERGEHGLRQPRCIRFGEPVGRIHGAGEGATLAEESGVRAEDVGGKLKESGGHLPWRETLQEDIGGAGKNLELVTNCFHDLLQLERRSVRRPGTGRMALPPLPQIPGQSP